MANEHQSLSDEFTEEMEQAGFVPVLIKGWTTALRDSHDRIFSHWRTPYGTLENDANLYGPWLKKKIAEGKGVFQQPQNEEE